MIDLTPDEWAALTPEEQDELLEHLEALAGGEGLQDFMTRMAPHHPPPGHLKQLIDAMEEARVTRNLIIAVSMPPGHAKSYLFVHAIAWWLSKFPADTCAYNSYNADQAHEKSAMARVLALRAGVELSGETNAKGLWRTTSGGGLIAGGMQSLTGKRVQGPLVIDDPYAGPEDAFSPAYREHAFDKIQTVAMTRLEGGAPLFLCHTRWHPDDAIGRLKRMQREGAISGVRFINLPAISPEGLALWPTMYPIEFFEKRRRIIGEFNFAALFQGEPRPRGASVFGDPHYYDPASTEMHGVRIILAADPAASEKTSADYSAAVVLAIKRVGDEEIGYVLHVYRAQVPIPQFANDLVGLQQRFGATAINVESVGGFKAIPQMLKAIRPDIRVKEITPIGDKFTRAQPVASAWNTGRLLLPSKGAPWLGPFLDELALFTGVNDASDDQVDALAHAWNHRGASATYESWGTTVPRRM